MEPTAWPSITSGQLAAKQRPRGQPDGVDNFLLDPPQPGATVSHSSSETNGSMKYIDRAAAAQPNLKPHFVGNAVV